MLVHKKGQININSRTDLTEIPYISYVMDTQLDIKANRFLSTSNRGCENGLETYDLCSEEVGIFLKGSLMSAFYFVQMKTFFLFLLLMVIFPMLGIQALFGKMLHVYGKKLKKWF